MKKIIFTYFIIIFSIENIECQSLSKYKIDLYYNWKYIGNVLSIDINKNYNKTSIIFGVSYYTNQIPKDINSFVFKDKAYGYYTLEHIGFNFGYKYTFQNHQILKTFVFSNLQYSRPRFRLEDGIEYNNYMNQNMSDLTPPHNVLEIIFSIGLNIKIYKELYFYQSVGIGHSFLFSKPNHLRSDYATSYRIGLSFHFGKINDSKN